MAAAFTAWIKLSAASLEGRSLLRWLPTITTGTSASRRSTRRGSSTSTINSNTSATAQVPPSSCPSDAFAFRGVFLLSAVPCSMAEHDVEYNLTGYVASPGMDLQVAQYVQSSAGNYWSYSCIDTSSTGSFSTVLEWDSSVHGEWSYLMISVTPDGDCYAYDSWWTSIGITMV